MKNKIGRIFSVLLALVLLGTLLPQALVSAEEPLPPKGDLNGDGKIHADDARIALQAAARAIETTSALLQNGDVDNDGKISSWDARRILRAAAKLEALPGQTGDAPQATFNGVYGLFSARLLRDLYQNGENILISPLSVMTALAMTENGAAGETLAQIEQTFGVGADTMKELLSAYLKDLPSSEKSRLVSANSLWIKENAFEELNKTFIDDNKTFYRAEVREAAFDGRTVDQINDWCKENTDGMIDKLLNEIPDEAVMYLIDALSFDAEWAEPYLGQLGEFDFTNADGSVVKAQMMCGTESTLIDTDLAEGFMKPYYGGDHSFAAVLPKNGASADELVASLDAQALVDMLTRAQPATVVTMMPKFESKYAQSLVDALKAMGMTDAFDPEKADLSGVGKLRDGLPIYVSEVLHKTAIEVNEQGTRAAAVTDVELAAGSAMPTREIVLDRPFLYMIVDNKAHLPIFIGVMNRMDPAAGTDAETASAPTENGPAEAEKEPTFAVFDGEKYVEIPLQFACAQLEDEYGDILAADGDRMFSSVEDIVRRTDLPQIVYGEAYDVKYAEPDGWETKVDLAVCRDNGDGGLELLSDVTELSRLPAGSYVLEYVYVVSRGNEFTSSSAIFHLIVE